MSNNKIFPDIKKVMRNCIAIGIIAGVANFQSVYPPIIRNLLFLLLLVLIIAFGIVVC